MAGLFESDDGDFAQYGSGRGSQRPHATNTGSSSSLLSLMGSGVIIRLFGSQISDLLSANPKLRKLIMRGSMGIGFIASLHQLIGSDFLPSVYFRFDDDLYKGLCKFVLDNKIRGFTLSWPLGGNTSLVQSTNYRRKRITPEIWWPTGHKGEKDVYYEKYGERVFYHNGTLFMLNVHPEHRRQSMPTGMAGLRALALNDNPIKALLQEVWDARHTIDGERFTNIIAATVMYRQPLWDQVARKPVRKLDTVNIKEEDRKRLVRDCENYLADSTREWYRQRGIPYRRGYLFHGAPGTGKSSLSLALAGIFHLDVYQLQLSNPEMDDTSVISLLQQLPRQCILLLEDVDSAGLTREVAKSVQKESDDSKPQKGNGVTLSGLLNALDGPSAPEGHILIMTSNHPENLDPALVRAGRIDYEFEFKLVDGEMAKDIFARMMRSDSGRVDDELQQQAETFANSIPEGVFAPAKIQGYLLEHIGKIDEALEGIQEWVEKAIKEADEKAKAAKEGGEEANEEDNDEDEDVEDKDAERAGVKVVKVKKGAGNSKATAKTKGRATKVKKEVTSKARKRKGKEETVAVRRSTRKQKP